MNGKNNGKSQGLEQISEEEIISSGLTEVEMEVARYFYLENISRLEISRRRKTSRSTTSSILGNIDEKVKKFRKDQGYWKESDENDFFKSSIAKMRKAEEEIAEAENIFAKAVNDFTKERKKYFGILYAIAMNFKKILEEERKLIGQQEEEKDGR